MTENYLQMIWAQKRLPYINMTLVDGRSLTINEFGEHNTQLAGPDFSMGSVTIDGLTWVGHIEIHVKSSDWYKHKHHVDHNYDNTVLHVVYEHDADVNQNDLVLPTLELKGYIDFKHFRAWRIKRFTKKDFPCSPSLSSLNPIYLESMKNKALIEKLNNKVRHVKSFNLEDEAAIFYHLLALVFGGIANKVGFEMLATRVSYKVLEQLNPEQRKRLLISESGVIQAETSSDRTCWNFKGAFPASFPSIRLRQFAQLIAYLDPHWIEKVKSELPRKDVLRKLINQLSGHGQINGVSLSTSFIDGIIINAIIPFFWMISEQNELVSYREASLQLLTELPAERNAITRKWKKEGVPMKNAFDTQSLLATDRYFCCRKKCLSCEVGVKILNRQE